MQDKAIKGTHVRTISTPPLCLPFGVTGRASALTRLPQALPFSTVAVRLVADFCQHQSMVYVLTLLFLPAQPVIGGDRRHRRRRRRRRLG